MSNNIKENVGDSVNDDEDLVHENVKTDEAHVDVINNKYVSKKFVKKSKKKVDKKKGTLKPKKTPSKKAKKTTKRKDISGKKK